jgi:hypothetical protein
MESWGKGKPGVVWCLGDGPAPTRQGRMFPAREKVTLTGC